MGNEFLITGNAGLKLAAAALILIVLYVLGIGPTNSLVNRGYLSIQQANVFYGSLINLAVQDNWLGECLSAYLRLWR